MGSWSVYCGISKIAITAGNSLVFLPIKKNTSYIGYKPYIPATLPIFGEYNDYGGVESIIIDDNTTLIENHFNCTIEQFVKSFTDEYELNSEEAKDWSYMFIHQDVYDFLVNLPLLSYLSLDMGSPEILKLLGFEYMGEDFDKERYKYMYKYQDKIFHSDGTWLNFNGTGIYYINNDYNGLLRYVTLPEDKIWLENKHMCQLWEYLDEVIAKEYVCEVIGANRTDHSYRRFQKTVGIDPVISTLQDKYVDQYKVHGKLLSELTIIAIHLNAMSGTFEPFIPYLTPQCGEREHHQLLLDGFAKINKSLIYENDR